VPFGIAAAYRFYALPFMDAFIREVLAGVILLAGVVITLSIAHPPAWIAVIAVLAAYTKPPLTRWIERTFLGYTESAEEQEERIGSAIRGLTALNEFGARISEILAGEMEAEWVEIGQDSRADAILRFDIPGSGLKLLAGPRRHRRPYMSRQQRIGRTAALQLAAHHHQLAQYELKEITARAQVRALQAQINPHFLFNTLNLLASLIQFDPEKAERITEKLAEIFRYALDSTRDEWVALGDEIEFLEAYLGIEKARFDERLAYAFEVDASMRTLKIPPMVLQPLVENAINHGIGQLLEGGEIRVRVRTERESVVIAVEDTGAGTRSLQRHRGAGIGLANVRERLNHIYGEAASCRLEERTEGGMRAVLVLPQRVQVHP
jgi:hypothetical protein